MPANYTAGAGGNDASRATVVVKLPADAKLYAEGKLLTLTTAERKFVTPPLPAGEFIYRFKVEYDRDGETVSVTKKVYVRAGGTASIEFTDLMAKQTPEKNPGGETNPNPTIPTSLTASSNSAVPSVMPPASAPAANPSANAAGSPTQPAERATITVKLPAGATLFVDDRKSPSSEPVRRFSTPPLPGGREFAYLMRAEIVRNGQTETFTQKVPFRAGERVDVDFTSVGR
jgi:uncharacterized protein (TIGR03000 family)